MPNRWHGMHNQIYTMAVIFAVCTVEHWAVIRFLWSAGVKPQEIEIEITDLTASPIQP